MNRQLLEIKNLNVFYGGIHALKDISLKVNSGEIVTLIGSTVLVDHYLRTISGLEKAKSGEILYENQNIVGIQASDIVKMGISHGPKVEGFWNHVCLGEP